MRPYYENNCVIFRMLFSKDFPKRNYQSLPNILAHSFFLYIAIWKRPSQTFLIISRMQHSLLPSILLVMMLLIYILSDGKELIKIAEHVAQLEADLDQKEREIEVEKEDLLEAKAMLTKLLQPSVPKITQSRAQSLSTSHEIRLLDDTEFHKIPQYLRGRLLLARINETVVSLNKIFHEKYSLLVRYDTRAQMSSNDRQKCIEWRQQEDDDSELPNKAFVTENEVKSVIKLDPTTRTIMSILRQVGRLKESRSAGIVRFLIQ